MKKFSRKNKKYLCLILIAVMAFNFVFLPTPVLAAWYNPADWFGDAIGWVGGRVILFVSSLISMILGAVFGVVLYLEAQIIDYIINPTNFSFTNSPIVTLGWGITRDLTNMFFILILLIIAFATVLKIQSYAIKQLWWKVLVAALLINFSLVIAGFVIDFTQVLTTFFLNQITGGGSFGTITTRLASSMQILNFYNPAAPTSELEGIADLGASSIAAILGLTLTLVGLVITVFVFGALAVFLIVRILHIWFLLIIAPIVWMLWIVPATSGQFSKWWDNFIKWTFFAPIYVFFIYLSLSIFDATGEPSPKAFWAFPSAWKTPAPGLTTVTMPAAIFQWILVIAMMFYSLIVAQKTGAEVGKVSRATLEGWGTKSKNWAGRQLRRQALGVGVKEAAPGVEARPGLLVRGAQKLAAIPGGRLLAGQFFKMQAGEAATVEAAQKQFSTWTSEGIKQYLQRSPGPISNALFRNQQIGAALALKEKGDLEELGEPRIKELAALASREYSKKELREILKVAPHLAPEFNEEIKKTVGKIEKPEDILIGSLKQIKVVAELSPQQLQTIVQKAGAEKIDALKNTVKESYDGLVAKGRLTQKDVAKINEYVIGLPSADRAPSRETRNKALRELAEDKKDPELEKIIRAMFTTRSPAWQT